MFTYHSLSLLISLFSFPATSSLAICNTPFPFSVYTFDIPLWGPDYHTCPIRNQLYTIAPSPGKGLGAFAAYDLEPGDVILREEPVILIEPPPLRQGMGYNVREVGQRVQSAFNLLPEESQMDILSLSSYSSAAEKNSLNYDPLNAIFRSNAYVSGDRIGLFPKIARINHSCRPNTSYFWDAKQNRRIVYATRKIQCGEELSVSYISLLLTHEDRQKRLNKYGFQCACEACGAKDHRSESDRRRQEIKRIFDDFDTTLTLQRPEGAAEKSQAARMVKASKRVISLVEEEHLADYHSKAYRIAAVCHARLEQREQAARWANKSYQLRIIADPHSPETLEMKTLTAQFARNFELVNSAADRA